MGSKGGGGIPGYVGFYLVLMRETKVLKQLVRNIIQPERDLGHSDSNPLKSRTEKIGEPSQASNKAAKQGDGNGEETNQDAEVCDDCN